MKKLAILLSLILLFPAPTFAKNWQDSGTRANECEGLARACSAAAAELKAARELIKGYEAQIAAADARIELAQKEIESLKKLTAMERERAAQLEAAISAEQEAKAKLIKIKDEQATRVAKLERQLHRSRKVALIAGLVALVAILLGARK
jgi:chromosome segregation ATPase